MTLGSVVTLSLTSGLPLEDVDLFRWNSPEDDGRIEKLRRLETGEALDELSSCVVASKDGIETSE